MTFYLTLVEALAIHQDQIIRYGGTGGIRDYGFLEAALFRPQIGYYKDLVEEAAALWESVSQNHLFIDGNKRTAFGLMYTFLALNEIRLIADPDETYRFIFQLYEKDMFHREHLSTWVRDHASTLSCL